MSAQTHSDSQAGSDEAGAGSSDARAPDGDASPSMARGTLVQMLAFYGLMALAALALRFWLVSDAPVLGAGRVVPVWQQVAAGLGGGLALLLTGEVSLRISEGARALTRWLRMHLQGLHPAVALLLALVSSGAEELLFRGALLPMLGLLLSSLLFGLVHVGPAGARLWWMVWATLAGLLFGALTLWTGALLAPFLAHLVVNGVNLLRLSTSARSR